MKKLPPKVAFWILFVLVLFAVFTGISFGAVRIDFSEILGSFGAGEAAHAPSPGKVVFWQLRLPRVIIGLLVGASLSVAGALMQGLFRNPLADPGLVGVSSGAALGAVSIIVLGDRFEILRPLSGPYLVPVAALLGAWVVTWMILRFGSQRGSAAVATLLLAGIAINAFVGAFIGLCTFLATDAQLRSLNFWMLGSLGGSSWESLLLLLPFTFVLLVCAPRLAHALNAFSLGEAEADHLGFHPEKVKKLIILLTAIGVGGCVAQTGMIGFVGMVVPHLFRLAVGPNHRFLLPGSALLGAAVVVIADTASRTLVIPAELPIGIVTAVVGSPFFLGLLWQHKRKLAWL